MRPELVRVVAVALLVFSPVTIVIVFALSSAAGSEVIWQDPAVAGPGGATGVALEANTWYRLVLETDCYVGNFSAHLKVQAGESQSALVDWPYGLSATAHACRSRDTTREFLSPAAANATVSWEAHPDVFDHHARVFLVKVAMPVGQALQLSVFSLYGGVNAFAGGLTVLGLWRRRPPGRMPTSVPSAHAALRTLSAPP